VVLIQNKQAMLDTSKCFAVNQQIKLYGSSTFFYKDPILVDGKAKHLDTVFFMSK